LCIVCGISLLAGCVPAKQPAAPVSAPQTAIQSPGPAPAERAAQPEQGQTTTQPSLIQLDQSERSELVRRILDLTKKGDPVNPEDFEAGPILVGNLSADSQAGAALSTTRGFLRDLKAGAYKAPAAKPQRFIDTLLSSHQADFSAIQLVRVLSGYRVEADEAAFQLRLLGVSGSASISLYLRYSEADKRWSVYDLQGDLSHMTETGQNKYTDYIPQDVERSLIREGNAKPWL
jgi:hypothetical protein